MMKFLEGVMNTVANMGSLYYTTNFDKQNATCNAFM